MGQLLNIARRGHTDITVRGNEFLGGLPPGIGLAVGGEHTHVSFGQDPELFQLMGKPSPLTLCICLQPFGTGRSLFGWLRLSVV